MKEFAAVYELFLQKVYVQGTSDFEKKMAKDSVERLSPGSEAKIVSEGSEPDEFCTFLSIF